MIFRIAVKRQSFFDAMMRDKDIKLRAIMPKRARLARESPLPTAWEDAGMTIKIFLNQDFMSPHLHCDAHFPAIPATTRKPLQPHENLEVAAIATSEYIILGHEDEVVHVYFRAPSAPPRPSDTAIARFVPVTRVGIGRHPPIVTAPAVPPGDHMRNFRDRGRPTLGEYAGAA